MHIKAQRLFLVFAGLQMNIDLSSTVFQTPPLVETVLTGRANVGGCSKIFQVSFLKRYKNHNKNVKLCKEKLNKEKIFDILGM